MSIKTVQERLNALGFDAGAEDGLYGPDTERAILAALATMPRPAPIPTWIDSRAVALIKEFEGFRSEAYRDPVGIWTIGYGTTAAAGVGIEPRAGMRITEAEGEMFLRRALDKFAAAIRPMITAPVTPAEFGAFLSLAYNIGPAAFARSSALRHFNAGDKEAAGRAMLAWNRAGGRVLAGLARRRAAERELFLS